MRYLVALFITILLPCIAYGDILFHNLKVELDPANRTIDAVDTVTLKQPMEEIEFTLNKNLELKSIKSGGKDLRNQISENGNRKIIKVYGEGKTKIDFSYSGIIYDEIMKAKGLTFLRGDTTSGLISKEGVFLSSDSGWYPDIEGFLSVFDIDVIIKDGLKVITQGDLLKREYKDQYEYTEWRGSVPVDGLVLVASRYEIKTEEINGIKYSTYLSKENSHLSDIFIKGSQRYIEFYSKILGKYPYKHWSIVENFFSSGYGMPGFTLLDPLVIKQGERILKPGYIDHEIVHSWFGNFVYPDYSSGNWAEAITTYLTNYYYKESVLGEEEARRHRINTIEKYSIKIAPEREYPLRRFVSKKEDFENEIGYGKGSMVFHEMRRLIGDERFFNTLKSIVNRYGGKRASWDDLRSEFERVHGKDLSSFFNQWLERVQGPKLKLEDVTLEVKDKGYLIKGVILQEGDLYRLDLPVAIFTEAGVELFYLETKEKKKKFSFTVSGKPQTIEIDPDYHIFRMISQKDLHPCLNLFLERGNKYYLIAGEDREKQQLISLAERLKGEKGGEIISHPPLPPLYPPLVHPPSIPPLARGETWGVGSIFILGRPDINIPLKSLVIGDRHFIFRGKIYDRPSQAILYSLRNPYNEEEIITIYFGNSPEATIRARYLPYYGNDTYVIFDNGQPVERGYLERDRTDTKFTFGVLDKKSIERHVRFLASEKMKGRLPGTTEDKKVREYLSDRLREYGFKVYEQRFGIGSGDVKEKKLKAPVNFPVETGNVIGVIEGERYIILSAHHDHHGIDKGGNIYYGADDNASGVSAVLEIAKELSRHRFMKGIIVIFPGAEEWGLLGSRFYVRNPVVPVDKVIAALNIDSIGRGDDSLYIVGSSIYPELAGISRKYIVKKGLLEGKDIDRYAFKEGSDHYSFHETGIPSIDFFSSDYKMIDMPGDDPDKIDFDKVKRIGEVVYQTAFELLLR
jgi:hypothetical protein